MSTVNGFERVIDLGEALTETKQGSPTPPFYPDSTFGFGSRPDGEDTNP